MSAEDKNLKTEKELLNALIMRHGKELYTKFKNATVAVCGLGGLGSAVALMLARAGVGHLHLIDFDKVDVSNLNRQQYSLNQVGMYKTQALKENILSACPYCEVLLHNTKITEKNISELLKDDDIICEAFDNAECKAMLLNEVAQNLRDKYLICASGMAGLRCANEIKTKKITEKIYICGDFKSDVDNGGTLFSSRVMVCAAHQANIILRIIANDL